MKKRKSRESSLKKFYGGWKMHQIHLTGPPLQSLQEAQRHLYADDLILQLRRQQGLAQGTIEDSLQP